MNHIMIEGFMGSGKTSAGKLLSKEMNLPLIDVDKKITEKMKMTSGDIYERFGEAYYRAMETFVLVGLTEEKKRSVIILGSGLPLMPQNEKYLKQLGTVYFLKVKQATVVERLEKSEKHSWLKTGDLAERVARMMKEREPAYKKVADYIVKADDMTVEEIVRGILQNEEKVEHEAEEKSDALEAEADAKPADAKPAEAKPAKTKKKQN